MTNEMKSNLQMLLPIVAIALAILSLWLKH